MDTTKYLNRIHLSGEFEPNLAFLQKLQKNHLLHIPFENLDIHLGTPIILDIENIYRKIVDNKRGGFCYELNGLFHELLIILGFHSKRISARVYDKEKGYSKEFDHMALVVAIDQTEYLVDVGFGEFIFAPLALEINKTQKDDRGLYVIQEYTDGYLRVNEIEEEVLRPEYIFQNVARELSEYKEMCQYHQTSPDSTFTQKKLISRPTEGGRITITGDKIKIKKGSKTKELLLKKNGAFEKAVLKYFSIEI